MLPEADKLQCKEQNNDTKERTLSAATVSEKKNVLLLQTLDKSELSLKGFTTFKHRPSSHRCSALRFDHALKCGHVTVSRRNMQRRGIPNEWASTLNSRRQSPSCCVSSCWGLKCTEPLSSSEVGVWCRADIKLGQFVSGGPVRHLVRFNELRFYNDQEWVHIWTTGSFTGISLRHSATGRALWRALYQPLSVWTCLSAGKATKHLLFFQQKWHFSAFKLALDRIFSTARTH